MTYTISVEPSRTPGKVTATSSDGHSLTTSTPTVQRRPLLATAKRTLNRCHRDSVVKRPRPLGTA